MTGRLRRRAAGEASQFWMNDCEAVLGIVVLLLIVGSLNVFSSSFVMAETNFGTPYFFLQRHGLNLAAGAMALFFGAMINYHRWRAFIHIIFISVLAALILVLIFGTTINGAQRWLSLGSIQVQPAEFAKVVAVFIEAAYIASRVHMGQPCQLLHGQLPFLLVMAALIEREPDGATALIVLGVPMIMLLFSNLPSKSKGGLLLGGAVLLVMVCIAQPYRLLRVIAMLNPWDDPQGAGYQVVQSLQAIGSGGLFGMGLGEGISKYHYLPEAHTDFAFAVLCQEMGFLGAAFIFILFASLAYYGARIARTARDPLGQILAFGLTVLIVGQAIANLFMVSGWGPVIGVPLPFISYGGSSLVVSLWAIGILLNIGAKSIPQKVAIVAEPVPEAAVVERRSYLRRIK